MSDSRAPAPIFLLAGGPGVDRARTNAMLERILASSGVSHPSVAYVGAASGDNRDFFLRISSYLTSCGAKKAVLVPTAGRRFDRAKTETILESCDMVFISGGDVEAGMEILTDRGILPTLRRLYDEGKPFFGMSAGSIMLAREWVRWDDPDDDSKPSLFPCMGLAPILCDVHGEDDDWEELHALLRLTPPGTRAYAIPSGAALCVHPDGKVESLSSPVVQFEKTDKTVRQVRDVPSPKA